MNREPEVLVIGAGVIGVAAAHSLGVRGRRVTVIDADTVGRGCSYGNAGLVVPSHSMPLATPGVLGQGLRWMLNPESPFYVRPRLDPALWSWLWRFRAASNEATARRAIPVLRDLLIAGRGCFDELTALEGMECDYRRDGNAWLFLTRKGLAAGYAEAELLREMGVESESLDGDGLRALAGLVRGDVLGGVRFRQDAHMDPFRFVTALADRARSLGVEFVERTECTGFETAGSRIRTVRTTRGDIHPESVVLATGSWSPQVARDLRLRLPIQPGKGYSLTFERPERCPEMPLMLMESKVAVTPFGKYLRLAGTLELVGMDFSISNRRVGAIRRAANRYLEGMEKMELVETWRGLRPCTPDGLPILGRSEKWENLILAAGHAMLGLSLGPVTGKIVARLVGGESPEFDLAPLRPERFG